MTRTGTTRIGTGASRLGATQGGDSTSLARARRHFDRLREAVRRYDAEATEDAWLDCEQWLEMVFAKVADADGCPAGTLPAKPRAA